MKRSLLATAGVLALCGLVASSAGASVLELGATTPSALVAPTCPKGVAPAQCTIILTRATALETIRDNIAYPTMVKQTGRVVALTVGLSALSTNPATALTDIKFLNKTYGGAPQVAITVLKGVGPKNRWTWQVVEQSPVVNVQPYLGEVAQFPLAATLPVVPGETIALTTPSWAPVLSIDLSTNRFAYRQSRSRNCNNPPAATQAQLTVGQTTAYACDYPGTRVEYSATEVTNPVAPKTADSTTTTPAKKTQRAG